jgi:hypothetical protein
MIVDLTKLYLQYLWTSYRSQSVMSFRILMGGKVTPRFEGNRY